MMSDYKLKAGKIGGVVVDAYKKVEEGFVRNFLEKDNSSNDGYSLKIGKVSDVVVDGYKKIEGQVVGGYEKIEHAFVDAFLEKVEKTEEPDPSARIQTQMSKNEAKCG